MSGELILVVNDEPNIVQLTHLYLERDGFHVSPVGDCKAALQAVERLKPVLIVLDIMLPELDGLEVCRRPGSVEAGFFQPARQCNQVYPSAWTGCHGCLASERLDRNPDFRYGAGYPGG